MVVLVWSYDLGWQLYDLWKGVAWLQQWWREENFSGFVLHENEREGGTCGVVLCLFLKKIISYRWYTIRYNVFHDPAITLLLKKI